MSRFIRRFPFFGHDRSGRHGRMSALPGTFVITTRALRPGVQCSPAASQSASQAASPRACRAPGGQPAISDQPEGDGGRRTRLPEAPHNSVAHPNARLLASRIENAELVTFPGLGHLFFWEDPGAPAAAVTTFLRRQDGSR